jgi:hypothetical protein
MTDGTEYRLAFILRESRQLLGIQASGAVELPRVIVPMWQRPAEQLTRLIEETWQIKSLVLDVLSGSLSTPCAVIEVNDSSWQFEHDGFIAASLDSIGNLFLDDRDRESLRSILSGGDAGRGPFTRIGWIVEAQRWIRAAVTNREVRFTDDIRHLNAGGTFSLLRLGTYSGSAYWLKAVGNPNTHEFGITTYLSAVCPQYLPRIVAVRTDWNAWAMEEFGASLHNSPVLEDFERAVVRLAHLQQELIDKCDCLLAAKCGDHRTQILRAYIDEAIDYLDYSMGSQTSTKVQKLPTVRLNEIGRLLHETCFALEALGVPDSLIHNDISPGSILSDGVDCRFTDWCEACVGNPFLTFEQICIHAARKTDEPQSWVKALRRAYKSSWTGLLTEHQIERAFQLAPLISVLSHLHGRGEWQHSPARSDPASMSYSRSLARHMNRIAESQGFMEALCLAK